MALKIASSRFAANALGAVIVTLIASCGALRAKPGTVSPASGSPPGAAASGSPPASILHATQVAEVTVAIAEFEGGSIPPDKKIEFWGRAIASFISADLGDSKNVKLVDRSRLIEVLREQRLSMSDFSDPDTRLRVGRILGAKYLIFGNYTIVAGAAALTARMDSVETGEIVESRSARGPEDNLRELSRQLSVVFLRPIDTIVAQREAAETLPQASPEADRYFSQGLADERRGDYAGAIDMYTRTITLSPHYPGARDHLEKVAEAAARQ